jgi:hypothetical protein
MARSDQEFKHYFLFSDYSRNNGKITDENDFEIMVFKNTWQELKVKIQNGKELHFKTSFYHLKETTKVVDEHGNKVGKLQISLRGEMTLITPDDKQLFCIKYLPREYRITVYHPEANTEIASAKWYFWFDPPEKSRRQPKYEICVYDETYSVFLLLSGIIFMFRRIKYG